MLIKNIALAAIFSPVFLFGCSHPKRIGSCWDSTQFKEGEVINGDVLLYASPTGGLLIYPRTCKGRAFSASPDEMVAKVRESMGTTYAVSKFAVPVDKFAKASIRSRVVGALGEYRLPKLNIESVDNIEVIAEPQWHRSNKVVP